MTLGPRRRKRHAEARRYLLEQLAVERDDLPAILTELERRGIAPARSTFYGWARDERGRVPQDASGAWSIATDTTGRPDVVLGLLAWLTVASKWRRTSLTRSEAAWAVRLSAALPRDVEQTLLRGYIGRSGESEAPRALFSFWQWVKTYVRLDAEGRSGELDSELAIAYLAFGGMMADRMPLSDTDEEIGDAR
jgi:hypothetical protein